MSFVIVFVLTAIVAVSQGDAADLSGPVDTSSRPTVTPFNATEARPRILTHLPDDGPDFEITNDFQVTPPLLPFRKTDAAVPERERRPSLHPHDPFSGLPLGLNLQTNNIVAFSTLEPSLSASLPGIIESVQSVNNDWTPISWPTQTPTASAGVIDNSVFPTASSTPTRIRPSQTRRPTSVPTVTVPVRIAPSRTRIQGPSSSLVPERTRTTTQTTPINSSTTPRPFTTPAIPSTTPTSSTTPNPISSTVPSTAPSAFSTTRKSFTTPVILNTTSGIPQEPVFSATAGPFLENVNPKPTVENASLENVVGNSSGTVETTASSVTTTPLKTLEPTTNTPQAVTSRVTTEFIEENGDGNLDEFTTFVAPALESGSKPELIPTSETNTALDNELDAAVTLAPAGEIGGESEESVGTTWLPVTLPNFITDGEQGSDILVPVVTPAQRSTTPPTSPEPEIGTELGGNVDQSLTSLDSEINVIPELKTELPTLTTANSVVNETVVENTVRTTAETRPTTPETTTQMSKTKTTTGRAFTAPFVIPASSTTGAIGSTVNKTKAPLHISKDEEPTTPFTEYYSPLPTEAYRAGLEPGIIAAIIVSVIVLLLIILGIMMIFVRKRQVRSAAYARRCNPSRLDMFNMDNVSPTQSFHRGSKSKLRASKRSFLNFAFDDNTGPSNSLTGAQLALFLEKEPSIDAEFSNIPNPGPRLDELPQGAEAKNRYANVIPVPETRVILTQIGEDPTSDYINANYIKGPKDEDKFYVACQGPMDNTVADFWRMAWETRTKLVFQLTDLYENGVARCAEYLPPSEVLDCHRLFGDFQVTLKKRELKENFVISFLQLKNLEENLAREVTHYWYTGWPAQGVPEDPRDIVNMLMEARTLLHGHQGPAVVHCSPGTGRTGTLIAIDIALRHLDERKYVDVPRIVARIRQERGGCVQTKEQYHYIYKAVHHYATRLNSAALDSL